MSIISATRPLISRIRFQLLGGIFMAIVLPIAIRFGEVPNMFPVNNITNTVFGALIAIVVGYFVARRLLAFPGVNAGGYILLSISLTFGAVVLFFFMFRLDYSRFLFAASYFISLLWFLSVHFTERQLVKTTMAVVQGGNSSDLMEIGTVNHRLLKKPSEYDTSMGTIVADLRFDHGDEWENFLADASLQGIPVYHTKLVQESLTGKVAIEHLSENNFGSLLPNIAYLRVKFLLDWVVAVLILPAFLVVTAFVYIWSLISRSGSPFFTQRRIGFRGNEFLVYKFRTMTPDLGSSNEDQGTRDKLMTKNDDDRITKLGRFLRKYRIDEFPQILNVLKGEMSWIGPRPEALQLSDWYQEELAFYRYRHIVRPGISGWAQVNQGHVTSSEDVLEKLHYDFFYIKYFSPWLDVLITLKTFRTIFSGFGAR